MERHVGVEEQKGTDEGVKRLKEMKNTILIKVEGD